MRDLNALSLPDLFGALAAADAAQLFELARIEDLREAGDVTSLCTIAPDARGCGVIRAREPGTASGLVSVPALLRAYASDLEWSPARSDGDSFETAVALGTLRGSARDLLAVERPLLNTLGRLCGIATETRRYVRAIAGTHAVICDTRKTTPGWRTLEKYAVRCGGAVLHRIGLYDAVLIKDNHIALAADVLPKVIRQAARDARSRFSPTFIEVEVDTIEQLSLVLDGADDPVDIVLLDNMTCAELREAVAMRDAAGSNVQLEASGGVTIDTVRDIAETGIDRISVGGITHAARWLDLGLDIEAP